ANASSELADIIAVPTDPTHSLIIGNVDSFHIGVVEMDSCGALVPPVWGTFQALQPPLPPIPIPGINNRGLVFSPASGRAFSPGDANLLFSFRSTGGLASTVQTSGAPHSATVFGTVAADELGTLFIGTTSNGSVVGFTPATLTTASPVAVAI